MKKYSVPIARTIVYYFEVEAEDVQEASDLASELYMEADLENLAQSDADTEILEITEK